MISAEFEHGKEIGDTHNDIQDYMESQGYVVETIVTAPMNLANDFIFVKKELLSFTWTQNNNDWSVLLLFYHWYDISLSLYVFLILLHKVPSLASCIIAKLMHFYKKLLVKA